MNEAPTDVKTLYWTNGFLFAGDMSGIVSI